jgi:very-short-patch-repair endonuclease
VRENEGKSRPLAKSIRRRMTKAETILWVEPRRDRLHGYRFRRQHPVGPFIADFACVPAKLIVEVDGVTHWSEEAFEYDRKREAYLKALGWRVLRVQNTDVYEQLDVVIGVIAAALPPSTAFGGPPPPPAGEDK